MMRVTDCHHPSTSTYPCLRFTLAEIQSATKNFDHELCIGKGGFGKVYKGQFSSEVAGHFVAIKRLDSMSNQGEPEFKAELEIHSKLRHCHLVPLIGYCDDNKEMILIYKYMPHGALSHHLHKAKTPLSWAQRLKIAVGAGCGLHYLHTHAGNGIIHRDVKSSNILLDENWEAMISDFGLSKPGPTNQSKSYVDASVKGTFGYLDPEYFYTGKLKMETDVYAFGVVLFELLSGRLAVDERYGEDHCSLVRWAQQCVKDKKLDLIVDSSISGTVFPKCLRGFAKTADRCLLSDPKKRPTMTEMLEDKIQACSRIEDY
ncbi:kinase RLK-Pelle-CrRLK1L-1 family protein [Tanacetum coccineum]